MNLKNFSDHHQIEIKAAQEATSRMTIYAVLACLVVDSSLEEVSLILEDIASEVK